MNRLFYDDLVQEIKKHGGIWETSAHAFGPWMHEHGGNFQIWTSLLRQGEIIDGEKNDLKKYILTIGEK